MRRDSEQYLNVLYYHFLSSSLKFVYLKYNEGVFYLSQKHTGLLRNLIQAIASVYSVLYYDLILYYNIGITILSLLLDS